MAATLPISPAVRPSAAARARQMPPPVRPASVFLPMTFIVVGLLSLSVAVCWLVLSPSLLSTYHYNQNIIALTHLFVLGWIGSVVMGATYQLVPVALETPLYSEKLARIHLVLHCAGFAGMVWMFKRWNLEHVGHFGSIFGAGIALFAVNIGCTLRRVPRWNVTAAAIAASLAWIACAALAGLLIVASKWVSGSESAPASSGLVVLGLKSIASLTGRFDPIAAMHAHAHLGAIGCFTMLILGVAYKVIPMFTLGDLQSRARAIASVVLLNLGLAGVFVTVLRRSPLRIVFAALAFTAILLFLVELSAIVRRRKRQTLDWGLRSFLTAMGCMVPAGLLALVFCWPGLPLTSFTGQLENLYGFVGFAGVISFAIIGMLYKIMPFLVWYKSYSRQVGRAQVPSLADLYSETRQLVGYWTYLIGLLITAVGIVQSSEAVVRAGSVLLAVSLFTLCLNIASMLRHVLRPDIKPLSVSPAANLKLA